MFRHGAPLSRACLRYLSTGFRCQRCRVPEHNTLPDPAGAYVSTPIPAKLIILYGNTGIKTARCFQAISLRRKTVPIIQEGRNARRWNRMVAFDEFWWKGEDIGSNDADHVVYYFLKTGRVPESIEEAYTITPFRYTDGGNII